MLASENLYRELLVAKDNPPHRPDEELLVDLLLIGELPTLS